MFAALCRLGGVLLLGLAAVLSSYCEAAALKLDLGDFTSPDFSLRDITLRIHGAHGERAELEVSSVTVGGRALTGLRISCAQFQLEDGYIDCRRGSLFAKGLREPLGVKLRIRPASSAGRLELHPAQGGVLSLELRSEKRVRARLERLQMAWLVEFLPQLAKMNVVGRVSGEFELSAGQILGSLFVDAAGFSDADGSHAGEKLDLSINGEADKRGADWHWRATLRWQNGGIFWSPVYLSAGPSIEAHGDWLADGRSSLRARLSAEGFESGELSLETAPGSADRYEFNLQGADLAILGPGFIAPWFARANPDVWRFAGRFDAFASLRGGDLVGLELSLRDVGVAHADGGLSAGPVAGRVSWQEGRVGSGVLHVAGGRWRRLAFGAFDVPFSMGPAGFRVAQARLPVLDSAVEVRDLEIRSGDQGLTGSASAVVEPLSLERLTQAADLPKMTGILSASIPRVRHVPGELKMDGALVISVFDGFVQATELRLVEPLGRVPRLEADVEVRHLDLGLLTQTFSFGRITGYLDGNLNELQLSNWQPSRFDAHLVSSPGRYPRRISQRAVQNISSLGGAGASAAIQRSFLGLFESFGYRRLGVSCELRDGVALISGLAGGDKPDGGFTLIQGGGVPALNVIGYNRRVDWKELVDRLKAVIVSNVAPVVR